MAGIGDILLIHARPLRTRHSAAFDAKIGHGLCSTR